jgi:FixJ family two-component response regulator
VNEKAFSPHAGETSAERKSTVFIVDDDQAVRSAVLWMVRTARIDAEAFASAEDFLAEYDPARPGCIVLDVRMPGISGLELQDKLAQWNVATPIIVISGHAQVPMAIHAMRRGAFDFLEKPLDADRLLNRIKEAIAADAALRSHAADAAAVRGRLSRLSEREREVLDLIVVGRLNKQIARQFHLSERTVEKYRASLIKKMEAGSTAELIHLVLQSRMIAPEARPLKPTD